MSGWPYIEEVPFRFLSWGLFEQGFPIRDLLVCSWRCPSLEVCPSCCPFSFKLQGALSSMEGVWSGLSGEQGGATEWGAKRDSILPSEWPPVWQAPCVHISRKHSLQMETSGERWRNERQTLRAGFLHNSVLQQSHTFVSGRGFDLITAVWTEQRIFSLAKSLIVQLADGSLGHWQCAVGTHCMLGTG